ncbi:MAG TPA: hypothetical protein VFU55_13710 [Terracidiphilus sp.]|nr:hypothetical protein [Terracidiphilus sp.]
MTHPPTTVLLSELRTRSESKDLRLLFGREQASADAWAFLFANLGMSAN